MSASFRVDFAGPLISVQDRGRSGFLRFGVTESGPMDRVAFEILSQALGASPGFRAIEVSVGGVSLTCLSGAVTCGVVGGEFDIRIDGKVQPAWSIFSLTEGQVLTVRPGLSGSWCYLGFCGSLDSPDWLGSHAAHLASGLCGRAVQSEDQITISNAELRRELHAALPIPDFSRADRYVRIVPGPQDHLFAQETMELLIQERFSVTQDYDRMGFRLSGPNLTPQNALSIPSEALIRGSVQVPGHGDPLILMADHQTTGGYPKMATVISADIDRLAQVRSGDNIRFKFVSVTQAIAATRKSRARRDAYIETLADYRGSLSDRLMRMNLISGAVADTPE